MCYNLSFGMDDKGKSSRKDNQFEATDMASSIKHWDNCWTQSDVYDSSGTTSTSEPGEDYSVDCRSSGYLPSLHNQSHSFCRSQGCLCQSCLLGLVKAIALQGSLPNICTSMNSSHFVNSPFHTTSYSSTPVEVAQHMSKDAHCNGMNCSVARNTCNSRQSSYVSCNEFNKKVFFASASDFLESNGKKEATCLPHSGSRCVGSLDRRKRRLRSKIDRNHRVKSQSDLTCEDKKNKPHYCSLQHFQCSNKHSSTIEDRLQKLEQERSSLHMEISILSEQVDVQSSKINELENALKEKKDALRLMEETLQKEVLLRSALETQKLELLSSISEMKLKQASLEHENLALRSTNALSNSERFSRHAGHYSSLPRPPSSVKKGVMFACEDKTISADNKIYEKSGLPKSFALLSIDEIGDWLSGLGLEAYTSELKRWEATGTKLLDTPHHQLEKELDIKNVMHKKKILYAIECEKFNGAGFLGSDKMDNAAVLRWLDDIGLPQHKEAFYNAKVDGRVLHRLTTEDLLFLNVNAQLHAASLRRGIQVLRELNFEFDNLERRSTNNPMNNEIEGNQVSLWTNHRVMEWLRVVDLAEYAPNMRGSGVHGGLMVYEPRFNSELLASLLSIPPSKTLLRRHLTTHFNQIIGREIVQQKRQIESTLGFTPLTLTARLKMPKRSQFTLKRKKSKNEIDFGNLVCPLEDSPPVSDTEIAEHRRITGCI